MSKKIDLDELTWEEQGLLLLQAILAELKQIHGCVFDLAER